MKFVCSLFVVEDIQKSRFLYETILGQKVVSDFGENIAFEGGFAIHQRDHFLSLINGKEIVPGSHNFKLYFEDDDLEAIEKDLKARQFEFVHGIREQPWKQWVLRFYDYDRNIIEIGERLEHVAYRLHIEKYSLREIRKFTYLTSDQVKMAIKEYETK